MNGTHEHNWERVESKVYRSATDNSVFSVTTVSICDCGEINEREYVPKKV